MLAAFAMAAGITSLVLAPGADTTLGVTKGQNLFVANYSGEVFIEGSTKSEIRIQTEHSDEDKVMVSTSNGAIVVKAYSKHEGSRCADLRLTVPVWMNVAVSGIHTDVIVAGTQGQVKVETVHGDVVVRGGRKRIELNTVNQDICVSEAVGTVRAETVNGDAYVWKTQSDSVEISTVNGEIVYEGAMRENGVYRFASHNGDIAVAMPRSAGAMVAVSTFSGDFESSFPVTLTGTQNAKRFQFCVGNCSARVELESFQGTIQLYRGGSTNSARVQKVEQLVERIIDKRLERKIEKAQRIADKYFDRNKKRHDSHEDDDDEDGE